MGPPFRDTSRAWVMWGRAARPPDACHAHRPRVDQIRNAGTPRACVLGGAWASSLRAGAYRGPVDLEPLAACRLNSCSAKGAGRPRVRAGSALVAAMFDLHRKSWGVVYTVE